MKKSKCLICNEEFISKKELLLHNKTHSSMSYTCSICFKTCKLRSSYKKHLNSHEVTPSLKCYYGECKKVFRYKYDLTRHIKTHYKATQDWQNASCQWQEFEQMSNDEPEDCMRLLIDLEEGKNQHGFFGSLSIKESQVVESDQHQRFTKKY